MGKADFNKKTSFTNTLDLHLRKKLVQCDVWNITLYDAETWIPQKVDQKYLESSEMWCWRRMQKISCAVHVGNEEVSQRAEEYPANDKKKED